MTNASADLVRETRGHRWARRVLLVGWDAADWKMIDPLVEQGQMANLARFLEEGAMGNIATLTPALSPMLWNSIATGKYADKHGILGFAEPDPDSGRPRPVTSTSRKCKAVWNILSDAGLAAGAVNWFASHPAEPINGFVVTDRFPHPVGPPDREWPPVANSVHPEDSLHGACALRIHPAMITPAQAREFLPELGTWNVAEDRRVHKLRQLLAHCATVHAAATWFMQEREWDFCGIYYDAIDRFAHEFMEFYPPKMAHVTGEDFARYQHVMPACYRFHDMMLGRLMELAGDDATIILLSDHGFHCDDRRPAGSASIDEQPIAWHRPYGVLAIRGPHIKRDQRIYGASLLDIAPTILMLLGLPAARDMDGHALRQILDTDPDGLVIPQIETYEGNNQTGSAPRVRDDPAVQLEMLKHLADLGYIELDSIEKSDKLVTDRMRTLAQVYASTGRPALAVEQYELVLKREPKDLGTKMAMAWSLLALGRLDESERLLKEVLAGDEQSPRAQLFLAIIDLHRGQLEQSLMRLKAVEATDPTLPGVHRQLGLVYLKRRRPRDARKAFERAIELDPEDAAAHDGLGVVLRRLRRPAEAVYEHMQSIALMHYRPQSHIHLGLALAASGQIDWAIRAFHVALEMTPRNPFPHRCLARLYGRAKGDADRARLHQEIAARLRREAMKRTGSGPAGERGPRF